MISTYLARLVESLSGFSVVEDHGAGGGSTRLALERPSLIFVRVNASGYVHPFEIILLYIGIIYTYANG